MVKESYIQFWEDSITDLLIQDYWIGQLIQILPRRYGSLSKPSIVVEERLPVLMLPKDITEVQNAIFLLQELIPVQESVVEGASTLRIDTDPRISSFLLNYFGKVDLLGLDIPFMWRNLINNYRNQETILDWRALLHDFTSQFGARKIHYTKRRPSKRYGTVPGKAVRPKALLAILLDISASMKEQSINSFFKEMDRLLERGMDIVLFQVDDRIRSIEPYRAGMPVRIGRGGGTNFNQAFDYIEKEKKFDGLVICTDGMLQQRPRTINLNHIWILESRRDIPFSLSGNQAYLNH